MPRVPPVRLPTLAERACELRALKFPSAKVQPVQGRELRFLFLLAPTAFSRQYRCLLRLRLARSPEMFVMSPNLSALAEGRPLPHVYRHDEAGTKLCLWLPRKNEWLPQMPLCETYISWTSEWLNYFEEWLLTDDWTGGGEHPVPKKKRWA